MASKKKILADLTNKQRILRMVERWDDDISIEQALYHMHVMKEVMESIREVENGAECRDFDEVFDELERACDEEENAVQNVSKGRTRPAGTPRSNRGRRHPKNGKVLRESAKKMS